MPSEVAEHDEHDNDPEDEEQYREGRHGKSDCHVLLPQSVLPERVVVQEWRRQFHHSHGGRNQLDAAYPRK
eukprot:CAMPEP_0180438734 /NCGR_PEP_ID=MMETSP1036_2-20121128/12224_1 /TAXON_ID=632150 /ORGANISM="Azadinium spinosum, Strain 3D9" /LENGTH=70 /DNA_ID=CAMNT_0022444849 /DNA_START=266 /DNA_END=478 /DNA_ORIENTATION=+